MILQMRSNGVESVMRIRHKCPRCYIPDVYSYQHVKSGLVLSLPTYPVAYIGPRVTFLQYEVANAQILAHVWNDVCNHKHDLLLDRAKKFLDLKSNSALFPPLTMAFIIRKFHLDEFLARECVRETAAAVYRSLELDNLAHNSCLKRYNVGLPNVWANMNRQWAVPIVYRPENPRKFTQVHPILNFQNPNNAIFPSRKKPPPENTGSKRGRGGRGGRG